MTTSHWLRPHHLKSQEISADLVIVGAGYVGLSTAYWISEYRPDLKIIVIDRSLVGAGASGRNAGFLTKGSATFYKGLVHDWGKEKAKALYHFGQESLELVYQHILKFSPEIMLEKSTSLTLFQTEALKNQLKNKSFTPEDFDFTWKSGEKLASGLRGKFFGAYENGPEYAVNPLQLLTRLRLILVSRKIQILENQSAFEMTPEGIVTELNMIKCKQIVLALNAYFPNFHPAFKDLVTPFRAQMLAVELDDDIESNALHYDSPERVYWRKAQNKTLLIGGKRVLDKAGETGDFEKLSPIIQQGLEKYLREQLKVRFKVIHRWSGIMGFTEHELPFLSKAQAPIECFVVGGFSGHGMGFGFRSAKEVADLVTGQKSVSFFDAFKKVEFKL